MGLATGSLGNERQSRVAQTKNYDAVGTVLEMALSGTALPESFRELLEIPLRQRGKVLSEDPVPRWPAIVLAAAAAAGGDARVAAHVAAAVELFNAAADVFDEIADGDYSPLVEQADTGQALNAASALLMLAHRVVTDLPTVGVSTADIPLYTETLSTGALRAAAGQHLDLRAEGCTELSSEDALSIARQKAGSLGAMACRLGALTGTQDPGLLALYGSFGCHLGTIGQLMNDVQDAADGTGKSDDERSKSTLPRLYARATQSESPRLDLEASGALHFAWVIIEMERQAATEILDQLAAHNQQVEPLTDLLG